MLSSFPLLPRACAAGRKFGFVALVTLVAGFFHLSAMRVDAQGSCSITSTTSTGIVATCVSSNTIQTPQAGTVGAPLSAPVIPSANYPDKVNVPYTGTVTDVQVTLKNVDSTIGTLHNGLFWTQVVLVSPGNHALVFLGGLGYAADSANSLTMTFENGAVSAPFEPPSGSGSHLPSGSGPAIWKPTDILNFEGIGGGAVVPRLPAVAPDVPPTLTSANWPQPDGAATFATFTGDSAPGNWKLYLADWGGYAVEIQGWSLQLTIDQTAVNTTTSISTSANPATSGNNVTYTATVNTSSGSPGGTMAFYANGVAISSCSAVALSGGVAHCTVALAAGSAGQCETTTVPAFPTVCQGGQNTIQAKYSGENDSGGDFAPSSSNGLVQWIGAPAANITHSGNQWCNSSPLYAPNGGAATAYPSFIPVSGLSSSLITNVTVQLKGISSVSGILGQFLLVAPSSHNLDFLDKGFAGSASSAMDLSFADNAGQTPAGGAPSAGASYEPYDGNLGTDVFDAGSAPSSIPGVPTTINYPAPKGSSSNTFSSKFSGATANGNWALYLTNQGPGGGSLTLANGWCVTLTQSTGVATTTTVTSNVPNPAAVGQSVTYTATVKAGSTPVTSGSVTFLDNGATPTGTNVVALNGSGQATFTSSSLFDPVNIRSSTVNVLEGDHTITASFGGTSTADPSSGTFLQRIDNPTTITGSGQNYQACNSTGTPIGVYLGDGASGPFTPNPSIIKVAGLPGTVNSMKLTLKSFSTFFNAEANNIESLIAGPAGALDFFSKTGGSNPGPLAVGDYVFTDSATSTVPNSSFSFGTYKPTSNSPASDTFTSGYYTVPSFTYATPNGSGTFASTFSNSSPNGTWSLFFNAASHINTAGASGGWCMDFVQNAVAVSATAGHSGNGSGGDFVPSDPNAKITATIANNSGPGPTGAVSGDPLTVTDVLDPAFTYVSSTGSDTGWSCSNSVHTVTCTNSNAVAQGSNSKLVMNVSVSSAATGSKSNQISVIGAGVTPITSASDTIPIDANATLGVTLGHSGTFTQGGQAGEWDITVSNSATSASTGTITVTDALPTGYTLHGSSSTGSVWSCSGAGATTVMCTTSSVIGPGSSSMISLTVNIPANSATSVTNLGASAYGGGDLVHTSGNPATSGSDTVTVGQVPAFVGIPGVGSGNHQSATILTGFASPLVVTVADANSQPIQGVTVTFTPPAQTGASVTFAGGTTTAVTDASGNATSAVMTANSHAGTYLVTASATGATSASLQLTNSVGAPAAITVVSGSGQSANDTTAFAAPLVANVTDAGGNPVSGVTVTFTAPAQTGASVTFAGGVNTAITDASGNATSAVMTANSHVGDYQVVASVSSLPVPFSLTNSVGAATQLAVSAPSSTYMGIPLQFTVTVEDAGGNVVTTNSDALQLSSSDGAAVLPSNPALVSGSATLIATLNTLGAQTITAADSTAGLTSAPADITVNPVPSLVVDVATDDVGTAGNCAVQTDPTLNAGNTSCSLRDALLEAQALGAANIYFYPASFAGSPTISLAHGVLAIPANTAIIGLASGITVNAGNTSGVFSLGSGLSASIANLIIKGGHSNGGGGGLANNGGTLTVSNCTFTNNNSTHGGAVYANGGTLTVQDSTFASNQATDGSGAGIYVNLGTANISYSTFNNNSSNGSGGGIFVEAGTVTITNSTISGNAATGAPGGGLANNGPGTITLTNSIVAGNTSSTDTDVFGAVASGSANNLIGDGSGLTGITNGSNGNQIGTLASPTNPALTPLGNYGGPTQTVLPQPGSPAICAGLEAGIPSGVIYDQRGVGFPNTNTTYSSGTTCVDVGAVQTNYAMSFTTSPPATFNTVTTISPAPVVTLTESGLTATAATGSVTVSDSAGELTGTKSMGLSAGLATFSDLGISLAASGDKLTATLPLTGSIDLTADSDPFTALGPPSLTVAVTHPAGFMQGSTAEWDVTVGDAAGAQPTSGTINLVDTLPTGYTLSSYDSTGGAWACISTPPTSNTVACSTSTSIAAGGTSVIRLMVNVPIDSPVLVTNTAVASGGGDTLHTSGVSGSDTNVPVQQVAASIAPASATLSAPVGSAFSSLAVTVTDAGGVPVPGYSVAFTAPGSGASGTFGGSNPAITDASGLADPGAFTANTIAGSYTVVAQGSSLQATFNLTNTAGALTQLGLSYPPDVFSTWPVTITVIPEDQYGNALSSFTDSLHFDSSDPNADLPPDGSLCGCTGSYQFQVTFKATGPQTVTVTDTTTSLSQSAVANLNVIAPINLVVTTSDDPVLFSTECDPQTTPGVGSGVCSLRDALNEASSGLAANITFDTSKMILTTINLVNGVLEIPNDARIIGPTTGGPITVSGGGLSGVFQMTDPTAQGAIDGIAITGGFVNDSSLNGPSGAAIYNNGTLWVDGSAISGNNAVSDSEIAVGGAIYSDNDLEISNSTITGNTVSGAAEAFGGGIFNLSYVNASNLTVSNNTAEATAGGGFAAGGGILTGIYPYAEMDLDHSTISGNSAMGYFDGSGDAAGGGIANLGGDMWMEYSTIAGNSTTFGYFYGGGGVYCQCYQEFYNNTITGNASDTTGGGLLLDTGSLMVLSNTIISGNSGSGHKDLQNFSGGPTIDLGGNLVHARGIKLAPLANNGGQVQTALPLPGSAAICDGLVANIPFGETLDARGFPNVNSLYLAPDSCVDSGAVQTSYDMVFSGTPSPITPATYINANAAFQAAVTLSESGTSGPSGVSIPLKLNGNGTLTGGSGTTAAGVVNYSSLRVSAGGSNDSLTATVVLNRTLSTPLLLTRNSATFVAEATGPSAVSVTPSSGYGTTQPFSFVASSPSGAGHLAFVSMLFNNTITQANGCYLTYVVAGNKLTLLSDDGHGSTSGHPGTAGTLSNSQCSVDLASFTVASSGNTLTVTPTITFGNGFGGGATIYESAGDITGQNTGGFHKLGWWMPGTTPEAAPSVVSVTPSSGYGFTQQFSFVASSPNRAGNLAFVSMLFNTKISEVNGCYLTYTVVGNQLSLLSDDGSSSTSGHPGTAGTLSNTQCSVDLANTTVTASGNTLTVAPTITFADCFAGAQQIYESAGDIPGEKSGGFHKLGWWMVSAIPETAPSAVSVTPSSGYGFSQQFSFVASSTNGARNLAFVSMLFNSTVSQANGCYLTYIVAGNQLLLLSDDGNSSTSGHPGTTGTLSNSQCSVDLAKTTVTPCDNTLTIAPLITFEASFAGAQQIYESAGDIPGLKTGGFHKLGWWLVGTTPEGAPSAVSVTPSSGFGTTQPFSFVASSPNGASNLAFVSMLFNSTVSQAHSCYLTYITAANQLLLLSDDGNSSTSGHPGDTVTLSNSQCSVDLASFTVVPSGNTLTLTPTITFGGGFGGGVLIYESAGDKPGLNTGGFQKLGWWMPGNTPETAPSAVSVTPSSGSGFTQPFSFVASSPNGASNLAFVSMLFNSTVSQANGCYLTYIVAGNQLLLLSDDGNSSTSGHPGTTGTLSNSQCSVDLASFTAVPSGNTLTVTPTITFTAGFAGAQKIYESAGDIPGLKTGGFHQLGSWTVGP